MRISRCCRYVTAVVLPVALIVFVSSCQMLAGTTVEQWDHVMVESEFSPIEGEEYLEYRYEDPRFNTTDMFDMYEISDEGLSHWDAYYAEECGTFLSQPVYAEGSVQWNAHAVGPDCVGGRTLRFYRISAE